MARAKNTRASRASLSEETKKPPARRGRPSKSAPVAEEEEAPQPSPQKSVDGSQRNRYSGTTARSSGAADALAPETETGTFSAEESYTMIQSLADLDKIAEEALKLLATDPGGPDPAFAELKAARIIPPKMSATSRAFKFIKSSLEGLVGRYTDGTYIVPEAALKGILQVGSLEAVSDKIARPDDVFYKANLATLLCQTFEASLAGLEKVPVDALASDTLDKLVSTCMEGGLDHFGQTNMVDDTLKLGIELRTMQVLRYVKQNLKSPGFDPVEYVESVFRMPGTSKLWQGWDVVGLHASQLKKPQVGEVQARFDELTSILSEQPDDVIEKLDETFPPLKLLYSSVKWAESRKEEVRKMIYVSGGVNAIAADLEKELVSRAELEATSMQAIQVLQSSYPPRASQGSDANANAQPAGGTQEADVNIHPLLRNPPLNPESIELAARTINAMADQEGVLGLGDEGAGSLDELPSQDARKGMLTHHRSMNVEANKENRPGATPRRALIDRQPGAQRIQWDDTQYSQASGSHAPTAPMVSSGYPDPSQANGNQLDNDKEVSEDEGFQNDMRPVANRAREQINRKRQFPGSQAHSQQKRVRGSTGVGYSGASMGPPPSYQTSDERHHYAYGPPPPGPMDELPPTPYEYSNQVAKARTVAERPKKVQRRKAWSKEEMERLQELIEQNGISWARIKNIDLSEGNIFETRDQVALKDKARNMKFDFLKARMPLPINFNLVPLKQSQVDDLINFGIDIDPNGHGVTGDEKEVPL